jgi:hypothetical protein
LESTQHLAFSIQPAQLFGAVSTGIFSSKVAKSKEARSQHHHRFHRIEQSVTFFEVGGMVLKTQKTHPSENRARVGHPQVSLRPHAALGHRWAAFCGTEAACRF